MFVSGDAGIFSDGSCLTSNSIAAMAMEFWQWVSVSKNKVQLRSVMLSGSCNVSLIYMAVMAAAKAIALYCRLR
jgi:ribonuclease HI